MAKYHGCFDDEKDVFAEFCVEEKDQKGVQILVAVYDQADYEGSAFVLFEKEGKLYEVNGGHCSCYGLEEQWDPEEVSPDELLFRLNKGHVYFGYGDSDMKKVNQDIRDVADWFEVLRDLDFVVGKDSFH